MVIVYNILYTRLYKMYFMQCHRFCHLPFLLLRVDSRDVEVIAECRFREIDKIEGGNGER